MNFFCREQEIYPISENNTKQNTMFFLVFSNEGIFDVVKEKAV